MASVFDFKAIRRKLERMEQKAEFEAKNPPAPNYDYGWPYGLSVPFAIDWGAVDGRMPRIGWGAPRMKITPTKTPFMEMMGKKNG